MGQKLKCINWAGVASWKGLGQNEISTAVEKKIGYMYLIIWLFLKILIYIWNKDTRFWGVINTIKNFEGKFLFITEAH